MSDNVTTLPVAALPDKPMHVERYLRCCSHARIIVDEHTRTVRCAELQCGAAIDPFDYLRTSARHIGAAWEHHRIVMQQASELAGRVHALKKEEQRLRAMVKRLQEKSGAVVNVRSREL